MKKIVLPILLLLPSLALAAPTGVVNGLHYNTASISFAFGEFDDYDVDFDGIEVAGSILLNENVFLTARIASGETDTVLWTDGLNVYADPLELTDMNAGIGVRYALSPGVDLTGTVGVAYRKFELGPLSESDSGPMLRAGLRGMVASNIELSGGATYTDLHDDSGLTYDLAGTAYLGDRFAATAGVTLYEDVTLYSIGVRFNF